MLGYVWGYIFGVGGLCTWAIYLGLYILGYIFGVICVGSYCGTGSRIRSILRTIRAY